MLHTLVQIKLAQQKLCQKLSKVVVAQQTIKLDYAENGVFTILLSILLSSRNSALLQTLTKFNRVNIQSCL